MLHYLRVGSRITIAQSHTHTMQQTYTHKAVTGRVEVKMLLSRRRQSEYSCKFLLDSKAYSGIPFLRTRLILDGTILVEYATVYHSAIKRNIFITKFSKNSTTLVLQRLIQFFPGSHTHTHTYKTKQKKTKTKTKTKTKQKKKQEQNKQTNKQKKKTHAAKG